MGSDYAALTRVLRAQLTAVHQQFVHILALRQWGLEATAGRVLEVDRIDFPIAMKIIDHMVAFGQSIRLASEPFSPGSCEVEILAAELAVDQRLHAALEAAERSASPVPNLVAAALAPRQSYADWLSHRISSARDQVPSRNALSKELARELAGVLSCIVVLIEQSMVHAFVHWHRGSKANADAAWAASGAAMMHGTRIVRWLAERDAVPIAQDLPPLQISELPDAAIEFDRQLARSFESRLTALSNSASGNLRNLCDPISTFAQRNADWKPGRDHPASETNPPAFQSFEKTLAKFVWV